MTAPLSPREVPPPASPASSAWRLARLAAGWALVGIGAVLTPTPLPVGLPMVAVGLYLLARDSMTVRRMIRDRRRAFPVLSRGLNGIKTRMPPGVRRMIEATDPAGGPLPQEGE